MPGLDKPYLKRALTEVLVEECLVHGHHVHPRLLDGGDPVSREEVVAAVDGWLTSRRSSGRGSPEEETGFLQISQQCEESVQFKIILSILFAQDYSGIRDSSRVAGLVFIPDPGKGIPETAAVYMEQRFTEEQVREASVIRVADPERYVLKRLQGYLVHGHHVQPQRLESPPFCYSSEKVKNAIGEFLAARARGTRSDEELAAFARIEELCMQHAEFRVGLSLLVEQDYLGIGASSRFKSLVVPSDRGADPRDRVSQELERRFSEVEAQAAALDEANDDDSCNVGSASSGHGEFVDRRVPRFHHVDYGDGATGDFIFVMRDSRLYLAQKEGGMQHSSFFGALEPLQSSGWIRLEEGTVVAYRRWSGHYKPGDGSEQAFREWAQQNGLRVQSRGGLELGPLKLGGKEQYDWLTVDPDEEGDTVTAIKRLISGILR